jgi:hypothetical protein
MVRRLAMLGVRTYLLQCDLNGQDILLCGVPEAVSILLLSDWARGHMDWARAVSTTLRLRQKTMQFRAVNIPALKLEPEDHRVEPETH